MNKTLLLGGLAAASLAVAGIAAAQTAPQASHHARGDADGDGRVSQAEFVDGRIARLTAQDTNRDGSVSPEERRAAMQARRAERADARFARLDADGNGSVTRAEFDAGHAARPDRGPRAGHRGGPRGQRAGMRAPREHGPVVIAEARDKLAASFARMDADKDGFVTADERRASMRLHRQARRERMSQPRAAAPAPAPAAVPAPTSE